MTFTLNHTTKNFPDLPYESIATDILGTKYDLTLNFVGATTGRRINLLNRKKDYVPNVLSFPLADRVGEIYITIKKAQEEAKRFSRTPKGHIGFLFVHGLLHLKGHDHGEKMESLEQKYCAKYHLT